jgi:hypothetical protein
MDISNSLLLFVGWFIFSGVSLVAGIGFLVYGIGAMVIELIKKFFSYFNRGLISNG